MKSSFTFTLHWTFQIFHLFKFIQVINFHILFFNRKGRRVFSLRSLRKNLAFFSVSFFLFENNLLC